jgi:hypothetical protein
MLCALLKKLGKKRGFNELSRLGKSFFSLNEE